jgi:type II secretory ATPase GspE/PulE/Tfp pilus assembly ATPase PilB-like protein
MKTKEEINGNDAVKMVDSIIADALAQGASDVYWIPNPEYCDVRFRINGVQKKIREIRSPELAAQCASRIKVLSGMLTYRSKTSQDGSIRGLANFAGAELRVAAMPTIHGERISIRIFCGGAGPKHLEDLGFQPAVLEGLRSMLLPSCGLIVLTGPTGSGKTTTIYAMVRELMRNSQDPASIISIEDPVEKVIGEISQVSLTRSGDDWGYEEALRAALRQDVKTLVIGEIRDYKVAKVVLNAALSGHRVITTLHAGDVPSVYARLLHQGFEPFLIASAITGVLSQRLVMSKDGTERIPVAAFLSPDDQWKDFIIANPGISELRRKIVEYPDADLKTVATGMAEKGMIFEKDAMLI